MANANRPTGLSPVKTLTGAPWNGQANLYSIAAAYASALAIGDPVASSGTADAAGVPGVVLATAGGAVRGVIVGLGKAPLIANPDNLNSTIRPANAPDEWYALVVDDPNVLFEVQDGGATPLAAADTGLNTDLVAGANNGFVSGWVVDGANKATTATLQVKLIGLSQRIDNAFGQYAKWLVKLNNHELAAGTAGV